MWAYILCAIFHGMPPPQVYVSHQTLILIYIFMQDSYTMGMGGFLWIINATSRRLTFSNKHSYQMTKWDFHDVSSQSQERFYIEYDQTPFKHKTDDGGEATFRLDGTNSCFELRARWPDVNECGLEVFWNVNTDLYDVFPPGGSCCELGWINNGSLALLIIEKGAKTTVCTSSPSKKSIVSPLAWKRAPPKLCIPWMEEYEDLLERLTLSELTLPGTHDSGTYKPVEAIESPFVKTLSIAKPFVKTQNLSIAKQLEYGIRVLDIRVGQKSGGRYIICHDKHKTRYSLREALGEVKGFIDNTNKEIVILDFHRFVSLDGEEFDYAELRQQISSELFEYAVPPSFEDQTLGAIWSRGSPQQRIVLAWNKSERDKSFMWPGVQQQWYKNADSPSKLYECIDEQSAKKGLWTECAFMTFGFSNPLDVHTSAERINPTISNWYFGGSSFCENANIISVDFFDEHSNIVQASVIGSLLKAGNKY